MYICQDGGYVVHVYIFQDSGCVFTVYICEDSGCVVSVYLLRQWLYISVKTAVVKLLCISAKTVAV